MVFLLFMLIYFYIDCFYFSSSVFSFSFDGFYFYCDVFIFLLMLFEVFVIYSYYVFKHNLGVAV